VAAGDKLLIRFADDQLAVTATPPDEHPVT
jgi:hypothetical protein